MNLNSKLLSLVLLLVAGQVTGQSLNISQKWSLEACIEYAWQNNLAIKTTQLTQMENEIAVKQAKFALLPNLNAGGGVGKSFGRTIDPVTNAFVSTEFLRGSLSANSNLTLYQGGVLRNTIKQNQLNLRASQFDLEKAKNDIGLQVTTNFLNVLLNTEQLENARYQLRVSEEQLERTRKQVAAGSLPLSNQLNIESQKASNEVQVVTAENALNLAVLNLKQSMQMPADQELEIAAPALTVEQVKMPVNTPSGVYEVALTHQPEIKSVELSIQSREMGIKISRGRFLPSLSISGGISTNYSDRARRLLRMQTVNIPAQQIGVVRGTNQAVFSNPSARSIPVFSDTYNLSDQFNDNLGQSVTINLNVPIFNRFSNTSNLQRAKIARQRAEIAAENTKNQLRQRIESAYNAALASLKSYEATIKRVAALEESFRATEQRYNAGGANFVDYQVAGNNLFAAKTDLVRAKYEYIFRVTILNFYLGNPITLDK